MTGSFFEKYDVKTLPFDPWAAIRKEKIILLTYAEYGNAASKTVEEIYSGFNSDGFSIFTKGEKIISYNDCNPTPRIRWTLTHELCHIYLEHIQREITQQERRMVDVAADRLTVNVICPIPVVHLCGVMCKEELQSLTGLSKQAAVYNFEKLQRARAAGNILKSTDDNKIVVRFLPFISSYITKKTIKNNGIDIFNFDLE